jgi:GTP-binding protein Era
LNTSPSEPENTPSESAPRTAFVALIGRTNIGKSSLVNRFVEAKVSIVTDRQQTTRRNVLGVWTEGEVQIVFVDTPGLHRPQDSEGKRMLRESRIALEGIDLVLALVEPGDRLQGGTQHLIDTLIRCGSPRSVLVINKIDTVPPTSKAVRETAETLCSAYPFQKIFPISALHGDGTQLLFENILEVAQPGPWHFPSEEVSNVGQEEYAAEIIREKAMQLTEQEVPHHIRVRIDHLTRSEKGDWRIHATILVDTESRKGILIGSRGKKIKEIGTAARLELQEILDAPVVLKTQVSIEKNWRQRSGD